VVSVCGPNIAIFSFILGVYTEQLLCIPIQSIDLSYLLFN